MKNKIFSLLTLATIGSILGACTKEQTLSYTRPWSRAELKEEFKKPSESKVYINENGQIIKINDPDDPNVNVLEELRMSQSVASLYYSDAKGSNAFNEKKQLSVTGYPLKASVGKVTWSSSEPAVASVSEDGLVTALKEGVAIITATSEVGKTATCRVVVNNNNVLLSTVGKSAAKILATQKSADFEPITTLSMFEEYTFSKKRDGVELSRSKWYQYMWASINDAYFRIISNDQDVKTAGGSIVPSNTEYTFYTTKEYLSYVFCNSNGKSNYMYLDQAFLVDQGKTPFEGLGEILQSFFVSGSGIMTRQFSDILGQQQLDNGYGSPKYKGSFGENSGQFAFNAISKNGGTISADDEDDMGIPAGTMVQITDDIRYLWEDNLLTAKLLTETLTYELNGQSYEEVYAITYTYQGRGVELWWPEVANYSQVDSIFDL